MTYAEKLKDHRWKVAEANLIRSAEGACDDCLQTGEPLAVYHARAVDDDDMIERTPPWDLPRPYFRVLCPHCAEGRSGRLKLTADLLPMLPPAALREVWRAVYSMHDLMIHDPGLGALLTERIKCAIDDTIHNDTPDHA